MSEHTYICMDLKSFYASVECLERKLDPMTTHLVVADGSRTSKTICLAITPALKTWGISGRPRLFEVESAIYKVNTGRLAKLKHYAFDGKSYDKEEVLNNPRLALDYIVAPPQMAKYMKYSARVVDVYLKYISIEDIYVYSIDEVFIDVTQYLMYYQCSAYELAKRMIKDVLKTVGVTATAGIGTNTYLAKVAMDIVAKHIEDDENGVRVASLNELSYRELLWNHRPITDFWRVGRGYAKKLEQNYLFTMGDIARCSIENENLLYKLFGINAELLIDHAWGWEPCTIQEIKSYRPTNHSLGSGQVLLSAYESMTARIVVREMMENLSYQMIEKAVMCDQIVLTISYDVDNVKLSERRQYIKEPIVIDSYGRQTPKSAHGTINLKRYTNSESELVEGVLKLYDRIVNAHLLVRRINISLNHVLAEQEAKKIQKVEQLNLFATQEQLPIKDDQASLEKERQAQNAIISIKKKYGKNALLKCSSLSEGATAKLRNRQIGGHKE